MSSVNLNKNIVIRYAILNKEGQFKKYYNDLFNVDCGLIFDSKQEAEASEFFHPDDGDKIVESIAQKIEGSWGK